MGRGHPVRREWCDVYFKPLSHWTVALDQGLKITRTRSTCKIRVALSHWKKVQKIWIL